MKLAERTTRATREIAEMTQMIHRRRRRRPWPACVACKVTDGVHLVNATEETLRRNNHEIGRAQEMIGEIRTGAGQQAAMTELAQNVERVSDVTEQNVAVINQKSTMVNCATVVTDNAVMQHGG